MFCFIRCILITEPVAQNWKKLITHADTTYSMVKLTQYHIPEAKAFNLLGTDSDTNSSSENGFIKQSDDNGRCLSR